MAIVMRDWLEEILVVLSYSTRTQVAIASAFAFFFAFLLAGQIFVERIELHGFLAPLTDVVRERLLHRYDKAAWIALGTFLLLAIKLYRRDRWWLLGH